MKVERGSIEVRGGKRDTYVWLTFDSEAEVRALVAATAAMAALPERVSRVESLLPDAPRDIIGAIRGQLPAKRERRKLNHAYGKLHDNALRAHNNARIGVYDPRLAVEPRFRTESAETSVAILALAGFCAMKIPDVVAIKRGYQLTAAEMLADITAQLSTELRDDMLPPTDSAPEQLLLWE